MQLVVMALRGRNSARFAAMHPTLQLYTRRVTNTVLVHYEWLKLRGQHEHEYFDMSAESNGAVFCPPKSICPDIGTMVLLNASLA